MSPGAGGPTPPDPSTPEDMADEPTDPAVAIGLRGPEALVGRTLGGRYTVLSRLGKGGMGRVYEAEQLGANRRVALKVLPPEPDGEGNFTARFMTEAATLARLNHPNTVTIFDFGHFENENLHFMAMELVDGRPLSEVLQAEAPLAPARALHIAYEISRSLGEAHRQGVVHRDLKPSNVMLVQGPDGEEVRVLDFGIVKVLHEDEGEITSSGQLVGSPRYMSPEQARGLPLDGRSDLYALGVVLYQMLAGRPPFMGRSTSETLILQLQADPPPISEHRGSDVPAPIEQIVLRLLQKAPEDRYADVGALRTDVLHAHGELSGTHASLPPTGAPSLVATSPSPDPARGFPLLAMVGGGLAGLAALIAGYLLLGHLVGL